MTHYTIDYSKLTGEAKRTKALDDIKDYLGAERFASLTESLRTDMPDATDEVYVLAMSFTGVTGYPAKAWIEYIRGLS